MDLSIVPVEIIPPLFGGVGGAVIGIMKYTQKRSEGEDFQLWKFIKSLLPAVLTGFASGVFVADYRLAFAAGLGGKMLWETYAKITK